MLSYPPSPSKFSSSHRLLPFQRTPVSKLPTPNFAQMIFAHRPRLILLLISLSVTFVFVYILATFTASLPDWNEEDLGGLEGRLFGEGSLGDIKGWREFDSREERVVTRSTKGIPALGWTNAFSAECLDQWISKGTLCPSFPAVPLAADSRIEVITSWTNGSDPLLLNWRKAVSEGLRGSWSRSKTQSWGDNPNNLKHFREFDELRYSIRSIISAFKQSKALGRIHLLTTDLPSDVSPSDLLRPDNVQKTTQEAKNDQSLGQIPTWLNLSALSSISKEDGFSTERTPDLRLVHHSSFFESNIHETNGIRDWLNGTLPTFNSLAIESQIANIDGVADHALYMNDDVFLLKQMSASDVASPLLGPVFRVQKDLFVQGQAPDQLIGSREGEWPGLMLSNWILDRRFGTRKRHYLTHFGKTLSMPLLKEAYQMWPEEFATTSRSRFRGRTNEVQTSFLATHFIIERHREALLWSYLVARSDENLDGTLSLTERRRMLVDLGYTNYLSDRKIHVNAPLRQSLAYVDSLFKAAGIYPPLVTAYHFDSRDGYLGGPSQGPNDYPVANSSRATKNTEPVCEIDGDVCFGDYFDSGEREVNTNSLFRRVAFERVECGDCLILFLVGKSGPTGLESFLPSAHKSDAEREARDETSTSSASSSTAPFLNPSQLLSMDKTWFDIDFAPNSTASKATIRQKALRLIQRYSYTIGATPSVFLSMRNQGSTLLALTRLNSDFGERFKTILPVSEDDRMQQNVAFLTINDDIQMFSIAARVKSVLHQFFDFVWKIPSPFELMETETEII